MLSSRRRPSQGRWRAATIAARSNGPRPWCSVAAGACSTHGASTRTTTGRRLCEADAPYQRCSAWSELAPMPISVHSLMTAHHGAAKKIWATEAVRRPAWAMRNIRASPSRNGPTWPSPSSGWSLALRWRSSIENADVQTSSGRVSLTSRSMANAGCAGCPGHRPPRSDSGTSWW